MKKFILVSGIVFINIFVIGALFKVLHWPFASILVTFGLGLFSLGFLPLAFIQSYKGNERKNKSLYIAGFICAFICFIGALFKIQHWPGANWFLIVGVPLPFLYFLPVYIYNHNKSKENSSVNFLGVMFLMVYIAVFSAILAVNVSRDILNAFNIVYNDNAKTNDLLSVKNTLKYEALEKSGIAANKEKIIQLKIKSETLCTQIDNIKIELVKSVEGNDSPAIEPGNKIYTSAIKAKDESIRTKKIMRGINEISGRAAELKVLVSNYREYLKSFVGNNDSSIKIIDELLSTSDITDTYNGEVNTLKWEDSFFPYGAYIVTVLGNLGSIETNVKMAEAEALETI